MDCADFRSQLGAQQYFDFVRPPGNPNGLDGDGLACEYNGPDVVQPLPAEPQQAAATETPTVTTTITATSTLPATGGLPLVPLAGASLLVLGVAGLAVRRRIS